MFGPFGRLKVNRLHNKSMSEKAPVVTVQLVTSLSSKALLNSKDDFKALVDERIFGGHKFIQALHAPCTQRTNYLTE